MAQPQVRRATESGVPDNRQFLHPLLAKNYGNWRYHDRPRPGVLHHVAHGGDEVWTVRAGTQRQMDVGTIRKLCDIADQYAEGHVRFTIRSNIEFMVSSFAKVGPLVAELEKNGFPVGGKRTLKIGDLMGTVVVPFMKLETDEDRARLVELGQKIIDFFAENALEHERTGEMIERIGIVNFLEALEIPIDANMVSSPRTNPYVRMDGWDEEVARINAAKKVA